MSNKCRYPSQLTESFLLMKWTLFVFTVIYSSKRASLLNRNFFSKCSRSRSFSLFPERGLCLRVVVMVLVEVVVFTLQGASLLRGFYFFVLNFQWKLNFHYKSQAFSQIRPSTYLSIESRSWTTALDDMRHSVCTKVEFSTLSGNMIYSIFVWNTIF